MNPNAKQLPHMGHAIELARELVEFTVPQLKAVYDAAPYFEDETRRQQYLALARSDIEAMFTFLDELRAQVL